MQDKLRARSGEETMSTDDQPAFIWQEGRRFDGRSQHVVVPHGPEWLLPGGTLVLDFTADRLKGVQGLLSKDAKGNLDGGHLGIWVDEGKVVVRLQDKKNDYIVESRPNTVKKEVPTRLALAFGPGGMKLYVDGKMVGSNAYQGGLQGNQEPVVIGARDWTSGPRSADHLEAYFAGTISVLALYGRPLEAPAIGALGPAGTALAQVARPGTGDQPPEGVGTGMPVDLRMPPVVVTGVQQPIVIEGEMTITVTPGPVEELDLQTQILRAQQSQQPLQLRSGASLHLQPWRDEAPAVAMFWQRAKQAAASSDMDEQRAALFVELIKAAFKPQKSDQELRGLEWWARIMKLKRIQAAEGAKKAYADWQNNTAGPRASRFDVMLGNDKVNPPSLDVLLASGFERVSGTGTDAANKSWPIVMKRLQAAQVELQTSGGGDVDTQAIIDGVVTTLSLLKDGFTGWTTVAGTAYSIASTRWKQVQEAEELPGKLEGFLSFARATTPSLTESLYTEEGAKQAYVALIETTL
jgi:Concanavalin A-like lectin/glucanases superfamily